MPFVERYHIKSGKSDEFDMGYFWWNAVSKRIEGTFCPPWSEQGCTSFLVQWEPGRAVIDGEYLQSGKEITWHGVFTKSGEEAFTQTSDLGESGSKQKRVTTIHATRRK
jgi:hypothetical protein